MVKSFFVKKFGGNRYLVLTSSGSLCYYIEVVSYTKYQ